MRFAAIVSTLLIVFTASAAELESRQLTHYVPQDRLETMVRTEGWTEIPLAVKGGVRKGDVVRIWAGGSIDRGNEDQPGENVVGPDGIEMLELELTNAELDVQVGQNKVRVGNTLIQLARVEKDKEKLKQLEGTLRADRAALEKAQAAVKLLLARTTISDVKRLALSPKKEHAFALLAKTETSGTKKCLHAGKPLEITLTKDKDKLWLGFNDEKGRYNDNHLGKGRRHEFDPLWVRIEVFRITVD